MYDGQMVQFISTCFVLIWLFGPWIRNHNNEGTPLRLVELTTPLAIYCILFWANRGHHLISEDRLSKEEIERYIETFGAPPPVNQPAPRGRIAHAVIWGIAILACASMLYPDYWVISPPPKFPWDP